MCMCVCTSQPTHCSALPFVQFQESGYSWLSALHSSCSAIAVLLCLWHCLTVVFLISNWAWKGKENCLRIAFYEYNVTSKPACLYSQRRGICTHNSKHLVQMRVCVCTGQQCSFSTNHRIPSNRPLGKVYLLWLQSHLQFTEVSDSKTSGTNCLKQSSLGLIFSEPKQAAGSSCVFLNVSEECLKQLVLE